MRPVVVLVIAASCILAGFAAGWFYRSHHRTSDAALEDYAISSILGNLAYAHSLASDDTKTARALIDTSLHANLNRVREHSGAITDPAFVEAKVRFGVRGVRIALLGSNGGTFVACPQCQLSGKNLTARG